MIRDSKPRNLAVGQAGEQIAKSFLRFRGLRPWIRSYSCRAGEIDLVCEIRPSFWDQIRRRFLSRQIVFVEVKTRQHLAPDHPAEAVDFQKELRLSKAGRHFLAEKRMKEAAYRFDIVAIRLNLDSGLAIIEHDEHAFESHDGV